MLRAGWANAPSYMLSRDSAFVHRTLLLARGAVALQRRVQKSTAIFANDKSHHMSMSSTEESGSSRPEQTHDASADGDQGAAANSERSIQLSDTQLETIVTQVAQHLSSHVSSTSQPSTSIPAAPTTTSGGEDALTTCFIVLVHSNCRGNPAIFQEGHTSETIHTLITRFPAQQQWCSSPARAARKP